MKVTIEGFDYEQDFEQPTCAHAPDDLADLLAENERLKNVLGKVGDLHYTHNARGEKECTECGTDWLCPTAAILSEANKEAS
jgi:hypothetical protein